MSNEKFIIRLDTGKCKACWQCIEKCQNKVIGKINIIIHKHAVLRHPEKCIGCFQCVKLCPNTAIRKITENSHIKA